MKIKKIISSKHGQSIFTQFGGSFFALLSFMILARTFSKEDFGEWILYLSLITFFDMIKSGMVQSAFIKYASGISGEKFKALQGSSWLLNIIITSVVGILTTSLYFIGYFQMEGIVLFLFMYPIYSFCSMPYNYYLWNSQIHLDFKEVAKGRILNSCLFLVISGFSFFYKMTIFDLVIGHTVTFLLVSLVSLIYKKSGVVSIVLSNKEDLKKYWDFGKFHSLAFLGSNLLKTSDTFLISGILGPVFVAIYSIPLRLIELIEMPLKGAVSVAYPVFSAHHNRQEMIGLKESLEKYIGVLTFIYVPFMITLFIFSNELVSIVGGKSYASTGTIFRVFLVYGLFLPFDRLTGIVLDALGRPRLNFFKVTIMASINIVGDFIALYYFESLELVALVTVGNVIAGMVVGYVISKRKLNIRIRSIFISGFNTIKQSIIKFKLIGL